MKLIVGLGNPGEKYESTRHNVGFMVVDRLLKDFETAKNAVWSEEKKFKSLIHTFEFSPKQGTPEKVILAKPQTFMNNSGQAVSLLSTYYKIAPADIWVVNDELDLPFGSIKIRNGGAAAGHHGVESIIASLNDDKFWRFRCGIGINAKHASLYIEEEGIEKKEIARRKVNNVDDYVLGTFASQEIGHLKELIKHASKAVEEALENGLKSAQNKYNTK